MNTKILTTHVGSLPRSKALSELLFAKDKGDSFSENEFDDVVKQNVSDIVKKQLDIGIDFVSDGEILLAVNSQFPRAMGAGAMRAALKAVKGEAIDEYVQLTPTKVFTSIDKIAIDTWLSERGYD